MSLAWDNRVAAEERTSSAWFLLVATVILLAAWCAAVWAPLGVSIVVVFLFAAPHNWMECRYFIQRMPARWGPLRVYYLSGLGGALSLALANLFLPSAARSWSVDGETWLTWLAVWNSLLVAWVVWLAHLRRREKQRKVNSQQGASDQAAAIWPLLYSGGWALIALAWLAPMGWSLALVFIHPLIALWFLDRELHRRRVPWRRAYRGMLAATPLALAGLMAILWSKPDLPGNDLVSMQITRHAGGDIIAGVSTHVLVATHVFLEMLHYAVWLLAIPAVGMQGQPWRLHKIPLTRKSHGWRLLVIAGLTLGALAVVGFWGGFLVNYPLARDIYFSVAVLHVLAEAPFLIRLL